MITEHDLREAIAECEGTRNPSASTCIKLAAFYTILNQMRGDTDHVRPTVQQYSFSAFPEVKYSDTEFSQVVKKKGLENCFPVIDEIMSALLVVNPALYHNAIRKLKT